MEGSVLGQPSSWRKAKFILKRVERQEGDSDLDDGDGGSEEEGDNVDKKIHKFENLLARLQGVVTQMETAEKEV